MACCCLGSQSGRAALESSLPRRQAEQHHSSRGSRRWLRGRGTSAAAAATVAPEEVVVQLRPGRRQRGCREQRNSINSGPAESEGEDSTEGGLLRSVPPPIAPPDEQQGWVVAPADPQLEYTSVQLMAARGCHSQIDLRHYLVPGLGSIAALPSYWGVMDRHAADSLLEGKPEGSFILRDSAQEDFLFSVSFRRFNRTLHARVEIRNGRFSFGSHDPSAFSADGLYGLLQQYKDNVLFYEPLLSKSVNRTFPFSLQALSRAAICSRTTYDGVSQLPLPRRLQDYLRTYHYKQTVRVRYLDHMPSRHFNSPEFDRNVQGSGNDLTAL